MRAVVALHALLPWQVLYIGTIQAKMRGAQAPLDPAEVDRRRGGGGAEALSIDATAEGVM